ncbi:MULTISPECIES: hypothetical protein [Thermomonosporaceae]|uniref:hypothetical protein n=1 Tax=Thermomonosporaceae TaxID=2012 RepID=UPI00255AD1DA|nr:MULTISPECIES: hypothetical protein [Thermomonosporaceae]MDL4772707.1 hypothetical protein [Actinomadura xylanilytica]
MPGRPNGWWISPAVPTIANGALAALWGFSAYGGWGEAAFCGESDARDAGCAADFENTVALSAPVAFLAAVAVLTAWSTPRLRSRPQRLDALLTVAAFGLVLAEGILFLGGYLAKP